MTSVLDYLVDYGIKTFNEEPFNEIDNIVLSSLTYLSWGKILTNKALLLKEAALKYFSLYPKEENAASEYGNRQHRMALALAAYSNRYKNIIVSDYVEVFCEEQSEQFAAMTFRYAPFDYYVAFKGTDGTLVGWREDFDMSYRHPVLAQIDAYNYLNKQIKKYGRFLVGGHSKGGNLAIFAGVEVDSDKVNTIYSNDGPGFLEEYLQTSKFIKNKDKIIQIVPEYAIVGMLLHSDYQQVVVASCTNDRLIQHDCLTWAVEGNQLVRLKDNSNFSKAIKQTHLEWFDKMHDEEQRMFLDLIYEVFDKCEVKTVGQLADKRGEVFNELKHAFKGYDKQIKSELYGHAFDLLKASGASIFGNYILKVNEQKDGNDD